MEKESAVKVYHTQRSMNKPLYFLGLTGGQLLLVFFCVLLLYLTLDIVGLLLIPALYFPCNRNYREWRNGSPDYLTSVRVWHKTPRWLADQGHLLRNL
jgi:hypothetical protein